MHTGENHEGQQAQTLRIKSAARRCCSFCGFCVSVSAALHVHPVNSQVARRSALTQVTTAVVETAAVVLACLHALKLRKKEKCEQFFHFFRPDFCSSSCPWIRSSFLLPSTVRSHPPPKVEKQAAGEVLESWMFTRQKFGF